MLFASHFSWIQKRQKRLVRTLGYTIWHLALCIRCHLALETHAFRALDSFIRFDYEWAGLLHFQSFSFSLAHRKARDELC